MNAPPRQARAGNVETLPGFGPDEPLPGQRFALPGDRVETRRPRSVSVQHVTMAIELDFTDQTAHVDCQLRLTCRAGRSDEIRLDACGLAVGSVAVDGKPTAHVEHGGAVVAIPCPRPLVAGDHVTVRLRYRVGRSAGLHWTATGGGTPAIAYTQGQPEYTRYWLPCVDDLAERLTTDLTITVPSGQIAVAGGELTGWDDDGRSATFRWRQDVATAPYLISFAAGELCEVDLGRSGNVPLRLYGRRGLAADLRRVFTPTAAMLAFLEQHIGVPYPYHGYAQVVVPEHVAGGMENASISHLSERVIASTDSEPAIVHELCHQWFGNLWTCADWSHLWLQEGFCRIFEVLWYEHTRGLDEAEAYRLERARWYYDEDRRYRRALVPACFTSPTDLFDRHSYDKSCLIVNLLRRWLGDDFWAGMRAFARDSAGRSVRFSALADAFARATGRQIEPVIGPLIRRPGHPELEWSAEWSPGTLMLVIEQVQAEPDYLVPVYVEVHDSTGARRVLVMVGQRRREIAFEQPERPAAVIVDPDRSVVGTVRARHTVTVAELAYLAAHHPHAAGRADAISELARTADEPSWRPVALAALRDSFWGVRVAAAHVLGHLPGLAARLRDELRAEPEARARAALVDVLSGYADTESSAAVRAALDDASPTVRSAATRALARGADDDAQAWTRRQLASSGRGDLIRCAALQGLAEGEQPGRAEIILDWTGEDRSPEARETAATQLVLLQPDEAAFRRLTELLHDPSAAIQLIAVVGLTRWGGNRAEEALATWLPSAVDDRARRACREGLAMLAAAR